MRRLLGALLAALGGILLVAAFTSPVSGRDLTVGTTVIYAEPGSHIELGRAPVGEGIGGMVCTWQATATAGNQHSVHPGNQILVTSGPTTIVLDGVEDVAGGSTTGTATGTLGSEIVVTLVMGPDGVFSGGVTVSVAFLGCEAPTTDAPTTDAPTTTVEPATTVQPTTEPPASVEPSVPTTVPTTVLPATTVDVVVAPSTTLPALTELPVTGAETTAALAGAGLALVLAGLALVRVSERVETVASS